MMELQAHLLMDPQVAASMRYGGDSQVFEDRHERRSRKTVFNTANLQRSRSLLLGFAERFRTTHREFANSSDFYEACEKAGIPNTKRQAAKFRQRRGLAYNA
jgi:hypothetical protein